MVAQPTLRITRETINDEEYLVISYADGRRCVVRFRQVSPQESGLRRPCLTREQWAIALDAFRRNQSNL